jgi:hypothetical protein
VFLWAMSGATHARKMNTSALFAVMECWIVPLCFELGKHLALRVVANDVGGNVTTEVESLGPEHRHLEACLG